jgi:hypothetical protein
MSDIQRGPDWWLGTDGRWYPPATPAPSPPSMAATPSDSPPSPVDATPTGQPPSPEQGESANRSNRTALVVIGAAAIVMVGLGAAAAVAFWPKGSEKHQLTGSIELVDTDQSYDGTCYGFGGYKDLNEGANVVVSDGNGKVLASGTLGGGTASSTYRCNFPITLGSKLPKADFYKVQVSHRGELTYSYDEMQSMNWDLSLTIGS